VNPYAVSKYLRDPAEMTARLAEPIADLGWQHKALCAQVDPDLHFPDKGESAAPAKRVCRSCEVRAECLEYALSHEDMARRGVWGGMSERERRRLKRTITESRELAA
jgi:WhiB family redox-sensing transcriptional regulator